MKTKLINMSDVKVDKDIYPRNSVDFVTVARYMKAFKSGQEFPPIAVAQIGKDYWLVDGMHRISARKANKETTIEAEILTGLDKQGIYIEAVKRNIIHGKQFNTFEVTNIIIKLGDMQLSEAAIQEIVHISAMELKPFVAKRAVRINETNENTALKKPFTHLAGGMIGQSIESVQAEFTGESQYEMIDSMVSLLESGYFNIEDDKAVGRLKTLYRLLGKFFGVEVKIPNKYVSIK